MCFLRKSAVNCKSKDKMSNYVQIISNSVHIIVTMCMELVMLSFDACKPLGLNDSRLHTPSIAFRHLPPNSARFSYVTEGALFISAQLSSDAVSALRKVRVLI